MKYLVTILVLMTYSIFGQVYPPQINLADIPLEQYTPPSDAPQYLQQTTNEFGNCVTRVSDILIFPNTNQLGHNYSTDQCWNVDETLIKLAGYPAAILDGTTYEVLYWSNIPGYGRWSNVHSNIIYGTTQNLFVSHEVQSNQRVTIHQFDEDVDFGYGEGNQDYYDEWVALIGNDNLYTLNIQDGTIHQTPRPQGDIDWISVSPLGNYVIISWRPDGSGSNQGLKKYNIDWSNEVHLSDYTAHSAMGLNEQDEEIYVQFGNQPQWNQGYSFEMINLNTNQSIPLFYWNNQGTSGVWGGHVSFGNRKGWVYISEGCCPNHTTLPQEIFALKTDGSNVIERYGKTHTDEINYYHSARASVSRSGTKVMYTSNHYVDEWKNFVNGHAWIVEVPQQTLSIEQPQSQQLIDRYYKNILGQPIDLKYYKGIYIQYSQYFDRIDAEIKVK